MLLDRAESQPVAAATTAAPLLALTDGAAEVPRQAGPKVESVAGGVPPHAAASHEASGTAAAPVSNFACSCGGDGACWQSGSVRYWAGDAIVIG